MKPCPVCRKPVSDFALRCPHCKAKMDTKPHHAEPVADIIPAKPSSPVKANYPAIVLLSLIVFLIRGLLHHIEFYFVAVFGDLALLSCSVANNQLCTIILSVFTAFSISFAMYFYHRRSSSVRGYVLVSLAVIAAFLLFHFLLSFLILPPELFLADSAAINYAKEALPAIILFHALLYPGYVLIAYWGICTLGSKKGYLAAAVGALLLTVIMVLRSPLPAVMGLSWITMYFAGFPLFAYLLFTGVLTAMKITTGRK